VDARRRKIDNRTVYYDMSYPDLVTDGVQDGDEAMHIILHWILNNLDRVLALIAIVVATIAIIDVRRLFQELEERDRNTENKVRQAVLKELLTHCASIATFFRAAQFIDFYENQPDRETAVAMLMAFRLQQLIAPDAKPEELAELRQKTRDKMENSSREYAQLIIKNGLGKFKPGWDFGEPPR
jgi:superfamily I DNA/RNA helicase